MRASRLLAAALCALAAHAAAQSHGPDPPAKASPAAAAAHDAATVTKADPPAAKKKAPTTVPAMSGAARGYVATGARPRSAGAADHGPATSARPKPTVSGLGAVKAAAPAAATDDPAAAAPAAPAPTHSATTRPARLSDVHERIAQALAEARVGDGAPRGEASPGSAGLPYGAAGASEARRPRVSLSWPKPRWQVAWPEPGHVALRWPEAAPVEAPAPAVVPPPRH